MIFTSDPVRSVLHIERPFNAPVDRVWKAWTTPELLDQWWAPRPYRTETHAHSMKPGGAWLYRMLSPEGEAHLCRADYSHVVPGREFVGTDAFCHDDWSRNMDFPSSTWTVRFTERGGLTVVVIDIAYANTADMELIISMGFQEGFTMALGNLDELLG